MTTYLLYNRQTQGERVVQDLAKRLEPLQLNVEMLDADTPRGIDFAEHYDIMARPAIVLATDGGTPIQSWLEPDRFPSPQEIAYTASQ